MWKAAIKVEPTLLIDKCHMFQIVRKEDYSSRTSEENKQAHDIADTQAKQASRDIQVQMLSCVGWFQTKSGNQCILHLFSSN